MKQFIVTEQEKYNILKQYGLLVEQGADYALDTQRFSNPKPIGSAADFYDANYGKPIPFTNIKLSISDWISLVSNFLGLPGFIVSVILELLTARYYQVKGDKYEMGLRLIFAVLPFDQFIKLSPGLKKYTKTQLFNLLLSIKNINKVKKEEISDILMLINNLKLNPKTIASYIYKFYLRIKIKSLISKMTLNEFLNFISKNLVTDKIPKNKKKWKTITSSIIKQLAKVGIIIVSWDYLFDAIANPKDKNYQKLKENLNKNLESFGDETIDEYVSLISNLEGIGNLLKNKK